MINLLILLLAFDLLVLLLVLKPALNMEAKIRRGEFDWFSLADWLGIVALVIGWFLDVWIARTKWAALAGWPEWKEVTISHTLERLVLDYGNPNHGIFIAVASRINSISPGHIKNLARALQERPA